MNKKEKTTVESHSKKAVPLEELHELQGFTGVVRTIQCYKHARTFNDFRILTIHIQENLITKIEQSDPYGSFEVLDQLDRMNNRAFDNLNMNYKDGKSFQK